MDEHCKNTDCIEFSLSFSLSLFAFDVFPVNQNRRCDSTRGKLLSRSFISLSLSLSPLAPRRREIPFAERWQVSRRRIYRTRPSSRRYLYSGYFYYREVSKDSKFPRHGASSFLLVLFVCFNIVRDDSRKEERKRGTEEYEILFPRGENVRAPIEHPRISLRTFSGRIFSTFNKSQISQVLQEKSIFLFFVSPLRSAKVSPCALFVSFQDERARERS